MSDNTNKFKQPWTLFDHPKFALYGEPWKKEEKDKPALKYKIHENNPRFRVYMNDGSATAARGPIAFALDPYIFNDLMELILLVASDRNPTRYTMEIKAGWDHKGQKLDKVGPVSKIFVGRDAEGIIYLAFQARGENIAKFPLLPSFFAELQDPNGEKLTKEIASEIRARSYVKTLSQATSAWMAVHGKEPAEKHGSGGNKNKTGSWSKEEKTSKSDDWDDVGF